MSKPSLITAAVILAGVLTSSPVMAEGDPQRGQAIAYSCLGCHGIAGYRNAYPSYRVPKLGGQTAGYLETALEGYREGMRRHPTMQAQAASLSDQEIRDVAAYLASLGEVGPAADAARGAPEAAAACVACHGQNGVGLSPAWPTLAGQHEDYLVHALEAYQSGDRKNAVMAPMAAALTAADVRQLARYYSRLPGLTTTLAD